MIRSDRARLVLLLLSLGLMGWLAFAWMTFERASWIQASWGYWFCLGATGAALICIWRVFRSEFGRIALQNVSYGSRVGFLIAVLATYLTFLHWPMEMRVFNDEPSNALVASAMAHERSVSMPDRGYVEGGAFIYTEPFTSYRLYYFSFLVSLLHNGLGERVGNAHLLNIALTFGLFLITFSLGKALAGNPSCGLLAQTFLLSCPLIGYVASSANYDLLNLFLLSSFFLSCLHFLEHGGRKRLDLAISVALLLAYTRSESVLFVSLLGFVFLFRVWRERSVELSLYAALSPLFLIVPVAARCLGKKLSDNLAAFYGGVETGFFDFSYIGENALSVLSWCFSMESGALNSVLVSILGFIGLLLLPLLCFLGRRGKGANFSFRNDVLLIAFGCVVLGHVLLLLCLYWDPTEASAVRFLLPLVFLLVMASVRLVAWIESFVPRRVFIWFFVVSCLYFWVWSLPQISRNTSRGVSIGTEFSHSTLDWVRENDDGRTLYVSKSPYILMLHGFPSISVWDLNNSVDKLPLIVGEGLYDRIQILDLEYFDSSVNRWVQLNPQMQLSESIQTKRIDVWRGYLHAVTTVRDVIAVKGEPLQSSAQIRNIEGAVTFDSDFDFFEYIRSIRP